MNTSMNSSKTPDDLPIVWANDDNFEHARVGRVFNHRRPNRFPLAVINATNEQHIKQAVQLANQLNCQVSIRSGGHSWAAWSVRDNAILIDLGGMNSINDYDESTGVVKVGPATTGEKLNGFLGRKGRMFNGGHCPTVGVGGFLLQGGMGWNCRGWGWAAEQIVGIDVVIADGSSVHCNEKVNSDLFWSARGSGPGFFAVVIQFHLQSRPLPVGMLASTYVWDISEYDAVMPWVIETSRIADPNIEIVALALYPDNTENAPPDQRLNLVVHLLTFNNSVDAARKSLEVFAETVPRKDDALVVNEYAVTSIAQEVVDQYKQNPEGHRYTADNVWLHSHLPTSQVVDSMRDVFISLPSVQTFTLYFNMAPERPLPDMALSLQTEHYLAVYCIWKDSKDDEKCQGWIRSRFEKMEKFSPGVYLGDSDFQVRKSEFLAPGRRQKLEALRGSWDPKSLFCSYLGL